MKQLIHCCSCSLQIVVPEHGPESQCCPRCGTFNHVPVVPDAAVSARFEPLPGLCIAPSGFTLGLGIHIVGRRSDKSHAQIQIDSHDMNMSRTHTRIAVTYDTHKCVNVSDAGSSNGTFVNEQPLLPGVAVMLQPGDILRMGETKFLYAD